MKLYIIGNGFDIHHGINSRYSDFKRYVRANDLELFEMLQDYFTDELWSDFEETLANIDIDVILDDASNYLVSYGADDWSDADHHSYQYEIDRVLGLITYRLRTHFTNWILQLQIPSEPHVKIDSKSIFLNFNYTNTLEKIYKVPLEQILYIHNKAVDENSTLILGHSREFNEENAYSRYNDEDSDPRVAQGNDSIDGYFKQTYKDTKTIIKENVSFFSNLGNIQEVYVLGHSISLVDILYFNLVRKLVNPEATWIVSYHGEAEKNVKQDKLINLNIEPQRIFLKTLDEI